MRRPDSITCSFHGPQNWPSPQRPVANAAVAQTEEHYLAKVMFEGSNPSAGSRRGRSGRTPGGGSPNRAARRGIEIRPPLGRAGLADPG